MTMHHGFSASLQAHVWVVYIGGSLTGKPHSEYRRRE